MNPAKHLPRQSIKTLLLVIVGLLSILTNPIHAEPGDESKLGFIEKISVGEALAGFGYTKMTCTSGNKTEDLKGYHIIATCSKGDDVFLVDMWVSLDWSVGHVNSVTKRN